MRRTGRTNNGTDCEGRIKSQYVRGRSLLDDVREEQVRMAFAGIKAAASIAEFERMTRILVKRANLRSDQERYMPPD